MEQSTIKPSTDPEWRKERARRAGQAGNSPEGLARRLVAGWPALTSEQQTRLRAVLRPVLVDGEGR